jgi:adenosine kinase
VSADGKRAMLEHARELKRRGVPTFIDPSHGLPMLERDELVEMIDGAAGYFVNDYEWSLTLDKTTLTRDGVLERCAAVIVTKGEHGSTIHTRDGDVEIPPVRAERVVDPTACGDAYRAGLLHGRARGHDWATSGRIGSLLGALQVGVPGAQNLELAPSAFRLRFEREFGTTL